MPEVEGRFTAVFLEKPCGIAEAAVDADGHARSFAGEFDQPGDELFAGTAGFKSDLRFTGCGGCPDASPDVAALTGGIDPTGPVDGDDALERGMVRGG